MRSFLTAARGLRTSAGRSGGLAGILFGAQPTAISPQRFTFLWSALILMAVVLGGMGSTPDVDFGAAFVSVLPELLRGAADYRYFVFGVLLIIAMIFRPEGLWPHRSIERSPPHGRPPPNQRREEGAPLSATAGTEPLLQVSDLTLRFGGVTAADGVTFSVDEAKNDQVGRVRPSSIGAGSYGCRCWSSSGPNRRRPARSRMPWSRRLCRQATKSVVAQFVIDRVIDM